MSEPVAYLATNPSHPSNADALVWEPKYWHITWEFKPLYIHPDPRVAELEAVLRECREVIEESQAYCEGPQWSPSMADDCAKQIAKIDEAMKAERDALKQQRDELLAAAEAIEIDAEECLDFDECTAMLVPIDTYHKLMEAIASINEK